MSCEQQTQYGKRVLGSNKSRAIHGGMRIRFSQLDALMAFFSEDLREDFTEVWQGHGPKYKELIKTHQNFEYTFGFHNLLEVGTLFWAFPLMRFKKIQLLPITSYSEIDSSRVFSLPQVMEYALDMKEFNGVAQLEKVSRTAFH